MPLGKWTEGLDAMADRDKTRSHDRNQYYDVVAAQAFSMFDLRGNVLDVGCGSGWSARWMRHASYTGIDPCAEQEGNLYRGVGEALPFEDKHFDGVLCYSVLQHVEHPQKVLEEAARVLSDAGRIGILVCVESEDPIFMHHWSSGELIHLVRETISIDRALWIPGFYTPDGFYLAMVGSKK